MENADELAEAITFGTDGWRAQLSEFTTPRVRLVAQAVATYLDDDGQEGPVAVGYDAREHSRDFAEELSRVLAANGRDVTLTDRDCPTPVLAWTVATGPYAGGLMITASHNPPSYNGVKFLPADGAPALPAVTDAIEQRLAAPDPVDSAEYGRIQERPLTDPFLDHALEFVEPSLSGMTVAYDAIHGSGRGVTNSLLRRAGATVERFRCNRDHSFGGVNPEPTPDTAENLRRAVVEGDADLGLINDGDADRVGFVTPERGYLDPNVVLALLYSYLLESADGDVVRTVSTSSLVDGLARAHGQEVHETQVGFKWVAEAMGARDALVGGEESGGSGVTAHLRSKDGVLLGLLLAAADHAESLDARIDRLLDEHGPIHQDRVSVDCPDGRKGAVLEALASAEPGAFAGTAVSNRVTIDGVKFVLTDGSWLLVRPSGTEPKLRVYAEAESRDRVAQLLAAGREFVSPMVEES
jgi:phosphomannomutase